MNGEPRYLLHYSKNEFRHLSRYITFMRFGRATVAMKKEYLLGLPPVWSSVFSFALSPYTSCC